MLRYALFLILALFAQPVAANEEPAATEVDKPQLLVLGTPHFANAGSHVAVSDIDNVMSDERQAELDRLVTRLMEYRPTKIAVEMDASRQDELDKRYRAYLAGEYALTANEIDQIGLRLAARMGLDRVYAVDWSETPPGGWDFYNYSKMAKRNNMEDRWEKFRLSVQADADAFDAFARCTTISQWLRRRNAPMAITHDHRDYYDVAQIGDAGAAWVGFWYTRNLHISQNIAALAIRPDDRVIAIYGSGHNYLLKQQAREWGTFRIANTLEYIPHEASTRCE